MAHSGHHSGGGYHGARVQSFQASILGICIWGILALISFIGQKFIPIEEKKPIEKNYTLSSYILDDENYFKDNVELRNGLEYLYEKTGVQIVVMTTSDNEYSDEKVLNEYYELFNDENHILIVIPTNNDSVQYYAIGDNANTVIGDSDLNKILWNISCLEALKNMTNMADGKIWEEQLKTLADDLIK